MSIKALTGLLTFLTLAYPATNKQFATQCSTMMFGAQNAPAMCIPGFQMSVPTAAEAAQGLKTTLSLKSKHPDFSSIQFTFDSARGDANAVFLHLDSLNGQRADGRCIVQRNSMNRSALSLVCSTSAMTFGQVLLANETAVNEMFSHFAAAHDLFHPTKPLGNAAPPPATPSAQDPSAGRAVNTYPLDGTCNRLELSSKDLTANCQPPALLYVPNAIAISQGDRPRIVLKTSDPTVPALTFYLGKASTSGDVLTFDLRGLNSYPGTNGAGCSLWKSPAQVRCGGSLQLPATVIRFQLSYSLTGDDDQLQAVRRGFREAEGTGAQTAALDKTGGVALSEDKLAIFGIAPGKPIPNGIPDCDARNVSNNVPFCVAPESERKTSDLFDMLGHAVNARMQAPNSRDQAARSLDRSLTALADPNVVRALGMRLYGLRVNPAIFDTSVLQSQGVDGNLRPRYYLSLVMGEGVVQYVSLRTTPPQWKAVFDMLQTKYGKPAELAWETITSPLNPNASVRVPNSAWNTQGLLVEYMGGSRLDVALATFIQRLEEQARKRANPPPPAGPPKRKL